MTPAELESAISLHPRACLFTGKLKERMKSGAPGSMPHYAEVNIALVGYTPQGEPDPTTLRPAQAEIEYGFIENTQTMLPAIQSLYGGAKGFYNLVQISFGRAGLGPSIAELRVLLEASKILEQIRRADTVVHMACLSVGVPGKYGVISGRLYLFGLWEAESGAPLWVNPHALANNALKSEYPSYQIHREVLDGVGPRVGATGRPIWFDELASAFDGLKGAVLTSKVFAARGRYLHKEGLAATAKEGAHLAARDYESIVQGSSASVPAAGIPSVPATAQPAPSMSRAAVLRK